jgi:hypothetical protein
MEQDVWLIYFEDQQVPAEIYSGDDAEVNARERFGILSSSWSCHLFRKDTVAINLRLNAHEGLVEALKVISGRKCGSDCQHRYMDPQEDPRNPRPDVRCAGCISKDALAQLEGK